MAKIIKQIEQKINRLKNELKGNDICENFGTKQIEELENFIGNIYEYDFYDRKIVEILKDEFSHWCYNYTNI